MARSANLPQPPEQSPHAEIPAALASPEAYLDSTTSVQVIETHISWVFLTDRFAYKLKKPVRFDFLDFSTSQLRQAACLEEVALNKRLAADVYLRVVPVAQSASGRIQVQGEGRVVDWLVKMKRLPADRALDVLIRTANVSLARDIDQLADHLATFYQAQPPVLMTGAAYCEELERHVVANQRELLAATHGFNHDQLHQLHQVQLRFLKGASDLLNQRVAEGRIVEGHGDLRPEHIYLLREPVVIDCIEFSREFRTLDVADELAFLSMECDMLGAAALPAPIIRRYSQLTGDPILSKLFDFYRTYRACVRAKVSALRSEQLPREQAQAALGQAENYLQLGCRYARSLGPPVLILMQGIPGTGKSTVAKVLAEELGMEHIQSDAVRQKLFGSEPSQAGYGEGRYSEANRHRVYEQLHRLAGGSLERGLSVILDATYLAAQHRAEAAATAKRCGAALLMVHCHCPRQVALERIGSRRAAGGSLSEAREQWIDNWVQLDADTQQLPPANTVNFDTSLDIRLEIRKVFSALGSACFGDLYE